VTAAECPKNAPGGGSVVDMLRLVIITGLSGAGKTLACRAMEDMGFYVVDNLPATLIPTFVQLCRSSAHVQRAALVLDIRGREFFAAATAALDTLTAQGVSFEVLFLEASDEVLIRRYKESRRQHPLAHDRRLQEGIAEERALLAPLRMRASRVVDTTHLRPAELRAQLAEYFGPAEATRMGVQVVTFGFKHGLPSDADLVFDVRFLPNPYYLPELRPRSGLEPEIAEYVLRGPTTARFLELLYGLLDFLLPLYEKEGKPQLVVAFGCTGGRHRSVVVGELLASRLRAQGWSVAVVHRDCDREQDTAQGG